MWGDHGVARVNLQAQITALAAKSPPELAADYAALFGRAPRRRHPDFLRKRIAHRLQENAYGGLPRVARAALDWLVAEIQLPPAVAAEVAPNAPSPQRGPRPGTMLQREWRSQQIRVLVTAEGFEWNGQRFRSLSGAAHAITGAKWNGKLFFGLTERASKP